MSKLKADTLPSWPAAMNQQMAAAYCGLSVETFTHFCPVLPVVITSSKTGKRYLRRRLDEWLLSLESPIPAKRQGMGALRIAGRATERA